MQHGKSEREERERRVQLGTSVGIAALISLLLLVVFSLGIYRAFVGKWVVTADAPSPSRVLNIATDGALLVRMRSQCQRVLREPKYAGLCGLSAVHFGYGIRYACMRKSDGNIIDIVNPELLHLEAARRVSDRRTLGVNDPMCTQSVVHVHSDLYDDEVELMVSPTFREKFQGSAARCLQKLVRLMSMNSTRDWPCVLSPVSDWQALSLNS